MAVKKTTLTPELAKQLLSNLHPKQRRTSRTTLAKYSRAMKAGLWRNDNPDPILIDKATGGMYNGGHRCLAVIDSGVTIEVMIDYQSDASLFDFIDIGLPRNAGQFIKAPAAYVRASAARIILWHEHETTFAKTLGGLNAYWQMSEVTTKADEMAETFDRLMPYAAAVYSRTSLSQSVVLAVASLASIYGWEDEAVQFCDSIANPVLLMPNDPAWILFDRMSRTTHREKRRQAIDDWTIFVRCFNAAVNGNPLPVGGVRLTGLWPRLGEPEKDFTRRLNTAASQAAKRRKAKEAA